MENKAKKKQSRLVRRVHRTRFKISGTAERPRLAVYRSVKHIYAQLIDDVQGKTLALVTDLGLSVKGTKTEKATQVGKALAEIAKKMGISQAVFDRHGRQYHGRVKAVAESARENGLQI
jgi:large subunit ribosomal protein L18